MDCFASLAMTAENGGCSPFGGSLGETFRHAPPAPLARRSKIPALRAIRLFSNDNAKFY